ncbi:MAG: TauD/TfdA family dioxygenase, partial [Betaproteobacteria bacterium]|nr:TauD/TfdA family dioxygenase [Betaproteobacteria bacterium]
LIWDKRCVLHRATEYDATNQGRVIRRCTIVGEVPA